MTRDKPWTALNVQQGINRLIREANPKDGSAPLNPVIELGHFVIKHEDLINRALVHYRQSKALAKLRKPLGE